MEKTLALILSIALIVILLATFIITFVVNKKTPVPKGCENIKIDEENCKSCTNQNCPIHKEREEK